METKWLAIMTVGLAVGMFGPLGIMEYGKSQCRIEAIKVNKSAEEINKICH